MLWSRHCEVHVLDVMYLYNSGWTSQRVHGFMLDMEVPKAISIIDTRAMPEFSRSKIAPHINEYIG